MPDSEAAASAPPGRAYRWGKFQGWCALSLGVVLVVLGAIFAPGNLLAGLLWLSTGIGIVQRRKYGFVLLYVIIALLLFEGLRKPPTPWASALYAVFLIFWGVPAALYYPRRWAEFR